VDFSLANRSNGKWSVFGRLYSELASIGNERRLVTLVLLGNDGLIAFEVPPLLFDVNWQSFLR
jgi:hypothetical protein